MKFEFVNVLLQGCVVQDKPRFSSRQCFVFLTCDVIKKAKKIIKKKIDGFSCILLDASPIYVAKMEMSYDLPDIMLDSNTIK